MEFVVLAKAVPDVESLEFDPVARTVRRDRGSLFLNPFDQRALRVALELRRPGERVTVVSLGPPAAADVLREVRAVGADRAVLLTDPAFAGSDLLATADALVAAIALVRPGVVLAGAASTESETGALGPEVAARLGWPVATGARSLRRLEAPPGFEGSFDTATGWRTCRFPAPAVVTVGEKIAKPLKPTPEALAGLDASAVERWSAEELGIDPARAGARGSPTVVAAVALAAPSRSAEVFAQGPVDRRVHAAVERLAVRLGTPPPPPSALPPPPPRRAADREALVLVSDSAGRLDRAVLGIVVALRRRFAGGWPSALWIGGPPSETETVLLERAGALAGTLVRAPPGPVGSASAARIVEELIVRRPELALVAFGTDPFGREVAGTVAGHRRLGLVTDAIDLDAAGPAEIRWTKPSFGGRTLARIRCRTRPNLATVRGEGFAVPEGAAPGGFGWTDLPLPFLPPVVRTLEEGVEPAAGAGSADGDVVVAFGMGIGGPEGIARAAPTVVRWGAAIAATRRVVDAGWVPRRLQVGLTGRALAPRLAVLLGASGSAHHSVGWRRAATVVAVNRDPDAPVFRDADVGIVGAVEEVLPVLEGPVARLLGR